MNYIIASFNSPYGEINSNWEKLGKSLKMTVDLPVNTTATIVFPTIETSSIYLGNKKVIDRENFIILKAENGKTFVKAGSGKYLFKTVFTI